VGLIPATDTGREKMGKTLTWVENICSFCLKSHLISILFCHGLSNILKDFPHRGQSRIETSAKKIMSVIKSWQN